MAVPELHPTLDELVEAVHARVRDALEPELDLLATAVIHAGELGKLGDQLTGHFMTLARRAGVSRERLFAMSERSRPRLLPRRHVDASSLEFKPRGVADPDAELLPKLGELVRIVDHRSNGSSLDGVVVARAVAKELWDLGDKLVAHFVMAAQSAGASWAQILAAGNVTHRVPDWRRRDREAVRTLMHAELESRRLGHDAIRTDDILLAVVREDDAIATKVLALLGITPEELRSHVEARVHAESGGERVGHVQPDSRRLTPLAKNVLQEGANREARKLGHDYIGAQHIILALAAEPEALGSAVLREFGVNYAGLYERLTHLRDPDADGANEG